MAKTKKQPQRKLQPGRLVKTGGKFSVGKIFIIAVSLVAIGSIFASVSLAGFNTGTITADNPLTRHKAGCAIFRPNGVYSGLICDLNTSGIVWWGPYLGYTINAPSGEYVTECVLINNSGDFLGPSYAEHIRLDMTSNNGAIVWGSRDFFVPAYTVAPYCYKFRIPQQGTLGGPLRLTGVEFRVWLPYKQLNNMVINSVSAHT